MKTGKNISLKLFNELKCCYGTVDSKNFKSLYVSISTWASPKSKSDNWKNTIGVLSRSTKHLVLDKISKDLFKKNFILDLDLRDSGISENKRSFMNIEIILYPKEGQTFKSDEIKNHITELIKEIQKEIINKNQHFSFHRTKKPTNK